MSQVRDKVFSQTHRFCWNPECNYLVPVNQTTCLKCFWTEAGGPNHHSPVKAVKAAAAKPVNGSTPQLHYFEDEARAQSSHQYVIHGACPSKSNCYRIGHKGLFKTEALRKYEDSFRSQFAGRGKMITERFELEIDVFYPSDRSDLDNSLKVALDCLQACKAIKNDRKCERIVAQKFIDKERPRIEFTITPTR